VVVNAMFGSPWSAFTVGATIPIALGMGVYMTRVRPGRVLEASLIGVGLVLSAALGIAVLVPLARHRAGHSGRRALYSTALRAQCATSSECGS